MHHTQEVPKIDKIDGLGKQMWTILTKLTILSLLTLLTMLTTGLHKLWYPSIRDTSMWSKFGAHGERGDVFLFSNLGAL